MAEKVGVEHVKVVLDLILEGVEAGVKIAKDGKIGVDDIGALVPVVLAVPPAIAALGSIPAELADLDEAEAADLVAHVMGKLAIDDAKAQAVIGAALKCAVSGLALVKAIQS